MQIIRNSIVGALLLVATAVRSQNQPVILAYIDTYKNLAVEEMKRTGVPASITLAQGIHETMAGTSKLVLKSNNHFGIKCKSNWTGESVSHDDDARGECFRKYPSAEDSYRDHSDFLKKGQRYAFLFELDPTDYSGWANGLKKAGYATNPKYPQALIKLIEDYNLQDYTLLALGKQEPQATDEVITVAKQGPAVQVAKVSTPVAEEKKPVVVKPTYPSGQFKINDTKVIYAAKGLSYLTIAQQYNVPLARLFDFNELRQAEQVDTDRLLFLERKRKTGEHDSYTVLPGETLHDIAQKEGIRLEALMELNWLKEGEMPLAGEQLSLKKKSSNIPKLAMKSSYSMPGMTTSN